jgi:hypothetical protein
VDLSSNEEDIFPDTSQDEEFFKKLFGDLNHGLLGPPDNGNVIVLSDSNEEEEVRAEDAVDVEVTPPSTVNSPTPTVSTADTDDAPNGVPDDSNGGRSPDQVQGDSSDGGDEVGEP